jgi:bifunctional DNA-binding transcriptional regulator/antitoxin component of YhaV-PrlF toxin-antitoxin module
LRRRHYGLNHGDFAVLATNDDQRTIVISRESSKETLIIAFNRGDEEARMHLRISAKHTAPIFVTRGETEAVKTHATKDGIDLALPALTGVVFRVD